MQSIVNINPEYFFIVKITQIVNELMILSNDNTLLKHDYFAQMKTIDLFKVTFFLSRQQRVYL